MYGGFVRWTKGELEDGTDSIASQVCDEAHWPEMEVLIFVVGPLYVSSLTHSFSLIHTNIHTFIDTFIHTFMHSYTFIHILVHNLLKLQDTSLSTFSCAVYP